MKRPGDHDPAEFSAFEQRLTVLLVGAAQTGTEPASRLEAVLAAAGPPQSMERLSSHRGRRPVAMVLASAAALLALLWWWPQGPGAVETTRDPAGGLIGDLTADSEVVLHEVAGSPAVVGLESAVTVTLDGWARPLSVGHPTEEWVRVHDGRWREFLAESPEAPVPLISDPGRAWCSATGTSPLLCTWSEQSSLLPAIISHSLSTVWLGVPSDAAVVVRSSDGEQAWQRPVRQVVAFPDTGVEGCASEPASAPTTDDRDLLEAFAPDGTLIASVDLCSGAYIVAPPGTGG